MSRLRQHIRSLAPILYLPFTADTISGSTAYDMSGLGRDLTLTGSGGPTRRFVDGTPCLEFSGSGQYGTLSDNADWTPGVTYDSLTWFAFFQLDTIASDERIIFMHRTSGVATSYTFSASLNGNLQCPAGGADAHVTEPDNANWYLQVGSYTVSSLARRIARIKLPNSGMEVTADTGSGSPANATGMWVGGIPEFAGFGLFDGAMAHIGILPYVLPLSDIPRLANAAYNR